MDFRKKIDTVFAPLIGEKCVIFNLPYYPNPGDALIWMGMEQFFSQNGVTCLYRASAESFVYRPLDKDVVICFVGGGNFGDLWTGDGELMVSKIAQLYPENRIIVFPQSVHYCSAKKMKIDAAILSKHSDLYICARDEKSYNLLEQNFANNKILYAPDMALYLNFDKDNTKPIRKLLLLERIDKEAVDYSCLKVFEADITDWPMMLPNTRYDSVYKKNKRLRHKILRILAKYCTTRLFIPIYQVFACHFLSVLKKSNVSYELKWHYVLSELNYMVYVAKTFGVKLNLLVDWFAYEYFMPIQVEYAVEFIKKYERIITTRLHAGVLAFLLDRQVELVDNSYGKISALYNAWLSEYSKICMKR